VAVAPPNRILAATALRIVFAGITTQLLRVLGLLLAGGILLLWVCWKMWRQLRTASPHEQREDSHAVRWQMRIAVEKPDPHFGLIRSRYPARISLSPNRGTITLPHTKTFMIYLSQA
jgi:hypothetical protein